MDKRVKPRAEAALEASITIPSLIHPSGSEVDATGGGGGSEPPLGKVEPNKYKEEEKR